MAGALGRLLRASQCLGGTDLSGVPLCPAHQPACGVWPQCVYGQLIRTQTLTATAKRRDVPRPLIVSLLDGGRERYRVGELLSLDITLMGESIKQFPALQSAIVQVGATGVGDDYQGGHGRFEVIQVRPLRGPRMAAVALSSADNGAYPVEWSSILERAHGLRGTSLRLDFVRPMRLLGAKGEGENAGPVRPEAFEFFSFWLSLSRRLKDLAFFHGDGPLELPFIDANAVRITSRDLRWWGAARYSGSQVCEVEASGLLGTVALEGEFELILPFLVAGEWLHVGKNTDLGDGRYNLTPL